MAIVINGSGTVTGISVGGLPDGIVDAGTLATNSVDSAELIDGAVDDSHMASISGRKNLIINGGMQVWQRATAATAGSDGYYTVDRWQIVENSSGALTSEKHTMSVAELNTTGHSSALKLVCTTADTATSAADYVFLRTKLEGQNLQQLQYGTSNAKTITLSFWVKSNKTGVYVLALYKKDTTAYTIPISYTISSADTWEQKTITITPTMGSTSFITGSGGVIDNNNGEGLEINFTMRSGTNWHPTADNTWGTSTSGLGLASQVNWMDSTSNNFYLAGIQLEVGSTATDFEHRSYGEELALCQRYYYMHAKGSGKPIGIGFYYSGAYCAAQIHFPTTMRASPSIEDVVGTGYYSLSRAGGDDSFDGFANEAVSENGVQIYVNSGTVNASTNGDAGRLHTANASAQIAFTAEL